MSPQRSRVEIQSWEARYYDLLLNVASLGRYPRLVEAAIEKMGIERGQSILDLGSGTGKNDCLIAGKTGPGGRVVGLDISNEMLRRARTRCRDYPYVTFEKQRIELPLSYEEHFDKVFICFVLHGFEDDAKLRIAQGAHRALKPGGVLCILDYAEFDLEGLWFPLRFAFTHGECELAAEFLKLDIKTMLSSQGFSGFREEFFFRGHVRLLDAAKAQRGSP